jgi:hypothetical protein
VGPTACLDGCGKFHPQRESIPDLPGRSYRGLDFQRRNKCVVRADTRALVMAVQSLQ